MPSKRTSVVPMSRRAVHRHLVALGVVALVACGGPADDAAVHSATVAGPVHVHGLGQDGSGLYVATHTGLFRVAGDELVAVGEATHDLMGFTVAGEDDLLASGHPDLRDESLQVEDKPPLLGLVHSRDGVTWEPLSLLGEVDFHGLVAAHDRVYGTDSTTGRFMVSSDRKTWQTRSQELAIADFAVSPDDPDLVVATTENGVVPSRDGGTTWDAVNRNRYGFLDWTDKGLYALTPQGQLAVSATAGASWQTRGTLGGSPQAFLVADEDIYAAVADKGIVRSDDDGVTFQLVAGTPSHNAQ